VVAQSGIQVTGVCHQHWKSSNMQCVAPGLEVLVFTGSQLFPAREQNELNAGICSQVFPPL